MIIGLTQLYENLDTTLNISADAPPRAWHNAAHSASHNQQWCKIILRALRGLHVLPKLEYTAHVNKEDDMLALEIRSLWVNPHFATTLSSCARCYADYRFHPFARN
jgi:hypothetical protein